MQKKCINKLYRALRKQGQSMGLDSRTVVGDLMKGLEDNLGEGRASKQFRKAFRNVLFQISQKQK